MTFKDDGTFSGSFSEAGAIVWEFAGKWTLKEDKLGYDYTQSTLKRIPPGTKDEDSILEIKPDSLVIKTASGKTRKYIRVISTDGDKH